METGAEDRLGEAHDVILEFDNQRGRTRAGYTVLCSAKKYVCLSLAIRH